jgi:hypothetical protein
MKGRSAKGRAHTKRGMGSNVLFLLIGMLLMGLVILLKSSRVSDRPAAKITIQPPAPWGEVEYTHFALGQPDEYLPEHECPAGGGVAL